MTVEHGGTLAPGNSIGSLFLQGGVVLESGSTLAVEIDDSGNDQVNSLGQLQLGGALEVSLLNALNPSLGNQFPILSTLVGPIDDDFEFFSLPLLGPGLTWSTSVVSTLDSQYILEVVAGTQLTADVDLDGDVDGRDFLLIQRYDPSLIAQWQSQYGSVAPLAAANYAVPEPATIILLLGTMAFVPLVRSGRCRDSD